MGADEETEVDETKFDGDESGFTVLDDGYGSDFDSDTFADAAKTSDVDLDEAFAFTLLPLVLAFRLVFVLRFLLLDVVVDSDVTDSTSTPSSASEEDGGGAMCNNISLIPLPRCRPRFLHPELRGARSTILVLRRWTSFRE